MKEKKASKNKPTKKKPLSARQKEWLFEQWDKNPDGMTFKEYCAMFTEGWD